MNDKESFAPTDSGPKLMEGGGAGGGGASHCRKISRGKSLLKIAYVIL